MELLSSAVLDDERYRMPPVVAGPTGLAWLRGHVARFSDGEDHARRRALVEQILSGLALEPSADPTAALVAAMGLPPECARDVALAAGAYQPHLPQSAAADAAVDRLVAVCGSRDEMTAARICVLVQAHAATAALVSNLRRGSTAPPVPTTRRVGPDGALVEVDLSDAPFGRGRHACPGEAIARDLTRAVTR
ncbi:hypothetical protein [Blastococcus haudaquaticus]|uniref:Cytochrome P450 n=1 Tax=Blastococcus haudaquaticus TaxID=1938745 RepID=A0A286GPN5_9ACTN|nr:hypothetical protein [Blastococcus haudaquaticus]SOD97493.1 hypothetical protein SAMN06272739_1508 [Blastococcus haudaquaticus]